jgi:hypothetical protein
MTTEITINKITVTPEAEYDYGCCLCERRPEQRSEAANGNSVPPRESGTPSPKLDKRALKTEVEEYIDTMNRAGRLLHNRYFRCRYGDEISGLTLMLFLYRAERLGIMQYWNLAGICRAGDWTEDAECDGSIRRWLKTKITDLSDDDWVIEERIRTDADKIGRGWSVRGTINGLPREVQNAIEYGNNQELVEAVSLLQNAVGKRAWRKYFERKVIVPRKLNKRPKRRGL